uniref:USO1 vesicle transport factor n=1 Tax=Pelodiscus sinensis TaxID=13735 RepID=K7FJJ8_PELSI
LTGQIAENLGEEEQLVQGLCALLLGISIYYNDNSLETHRKEKLKQLIEKRIGKENFIEKLGFISKHELYSRAAQKPQPCFSSPDHMMFDHEFTKLVKELEGIITKAIYKSSEEDKQEEEVKKTLEQHDNIVTHYKKVIREQDQQLEELKQTVNTLKSQNEQLQTAVTQQVAQIQQHKDQYNLLKVQLGKDNQHHSSHGDLPQMNGIQPEELSKLRQEIDELKRQHEVLQGQLREKDSVIENLTSLQPETGRTEQLSQITASAGLEHANELQRELEALRIQIQSQATDISKLQAEKQELLQQMNTASVPGLGESDAAKNSQLEGRLLQEIKELKNEVKALAEERASLKQNLDSVQSTVAVLQDEKSKLLLEVAESKKEQDDLLVLLADQDQKIFALKNKLKELGEPVEDEDDIESGDQGDEDEEEDGLEAALDAV